VSSVTAAMASATSGRQRRHTHGSKLGPFYRQMSGGWFAHVNAMMWLWHGHVARRHGTAATRLGDRRGRRGAAHAHVAHGRMG
jgi:hypothetical protein